MKNLLLFLDAKKKVCGGVGVEMEVGGAEVGVGDMWEQRRGQGGAGVGSKLR